MNRPVATVWRSFRATRFLVLLLSLLAVLGGTAYACNVPVFRYALERWQADAYRVTIFHRGPLSETEQSLLRPWETTAAARPLNVALRLVDVDQIANDADQVLLATQKSPQPPWLVVQYPQSLRLEKPIWSGPLNEASQQQLTSSPIRQELVRRLAEGQTAVWLMLEGGQAETDDAMAELLTDELVKLSQELKLPELTSAPEDNLLSDAPLKVAFSLLRVPRDEAEQFLVQMLLHSESDLFEFSDPMVFPVFGRGRALLPLIGPGITKDNIRGSAEFLVGACSCEIKELNPGFDLLLAVDWDVLLFQGPPPAQVLASRSTAPSGKPELVAIPAGSAATEKGAVTEMVTEASVDAAATETAQASAMTAGVSTSEYESDGPTATAEPPKYTFVLVVVGLLLIGGIAFKRWI